MVDKFNLIKEDSPCILCKYNPPELGVGKPCGMCFATPKEKKENQWFLTKNRKPKENTNVLVTFISSLDESRGVVRAYWDGKTFYVYGLRADYGEDRVPAWMPLPEPYEEEKHD